MRVVPLLAVLLALPALAGCAAFDALVDGPPRAPPARFDAVTFDTTHGAFTAILYPDAAPQTVAFLQRLVREGYYDGREFNRVIPGFVIQEVDRAGGATDQAERVPLEAGTRAHFSMGALGIARGADPDSGGSEFFVMDFAHAHLYGNYTAFAQVVHGMEVVHAIARVDAVSTGAVTGPASALPALPVGVHDRVAVTPARIHRATLTTVDLPAFAAAQYPRVVGERTVVDEPMTRYTPEWPANLGVRNLSAMTWFVYTRADDPMPDLADARALVVTPSGRQLAFVPTADPADPRILHWTWTPDERGAHVLQLERGGNVVAAARVDV